MILLDSDHLSVYMDDRESRNLSLTARLEATEEPVGCTIVSVEEIFRGRMAFIHRLRDVRRQLPAYRQLQHFIEVLNDWEIMEFDEHAANQFTALQRQRIRIGTMDLKIASIALVNNALLITSNDRDFTQVPGLRCENWLEPIT